MKCYHHPSRDAIAECKGFDSCGKGICKECYDDWKVNVGPWANQPLCYDCATLMVEFNAKDVLETGERVERMRKNSIIGMIIGGLIGLPFGGIGAWPGAGVGGTLGSLGIGYFFSKDENGERGFGPLIFAALAGPIFCIYYIIKDRNFLTQAQELVESEKESLRLMRDYFQYTLAMEKAGESDSFESLTSQGGELFDNSYARTVKEKGEKVAQEQLRESVVQIAANGEILRSNAPRGSNRAS